jgi:hypothetical protein
VLAPQPEAHAGVAPVVSQNGVAPAQLVAHAPQWALERRSASQPLLATPSQSAKPALHANPHVPLAPQLALMAGPSRALEARAAMHADMSFTCERDRLLERGTGFARILDAADANTTATVDIGALEQHPSIEDVANQAINEDASLGFSFNVGDASLVFDSVTATALFGYSWGK